MYICQVNDVNGLYHQGVLSRLQSLKERQKIDVTL